MCQCVRACISIYVTVSRCRVRACTSVYMAVSVSVRACVHFSMSSVMSVTESVRKRGPYTPPCAYRVSQFFISVDVALVG